MDSSTAINSETKLMIAVIENLKSFYAVAVTIQYVTFQGSTPHRHSPDREYNTQAVFLKHLGWKPTLILHFLHIFRLVFVTLKHRH